MLTVLQPGPLATVQDLGRPGVQAWGVTPGGAVDALALRMGNWLVGNPAGAAAIEMTLQGMTVAFSSPALIAITGASMEGDCLDENGTRTGNVIPAWRPVWVNAGAVLRWGRMREGARSYLCVQGGIDVRLVMGGAGTDVRSGFGGHCGRPLQAGDRLSLGSQADRYPKLRARLQAGVAWASARWEISRWRDWRCGPVRPIPWIPQAHADVALSAPTGLSAPAPMFAGECFAETWFGGECFTGERSAGECLVEDCLAGEWRALPASDRQGLRLSSLNPVDYRVKAISRRSAGVCFGVVQVPPDGQPIVLLADHQTTGGYPVAGVVASVARSQLAQTRPGDIVRFAPVSLAEAHNALVEREKRLCYLQRQLYWCQCEE